MSLASRIWHAGAYFGVGHQYVVVASVDAQPMMQLAIVEGRIDRVGCDDRGVEASAREIFKVADAVQGTPPHRSSRHRR